MREAEKEIQVMAMAKENGEREVERLVARDVEDKHLRMRDDSKVVETQELEASMNVNTGNGTTIFLSNKSSEYNCNYSYAICKATFEGVKSVGADILYIRELHSLAVCCFIQPLTLDGEESGRVRSRG